VAQVVRTSYCGLFRENLVPFVFEGGLCCQGARRYQLLFS